MKLFVLSALFFSLAAGPALGAEAQAPPEKVPVELYDTKGAMIAEIKVEKDKLDQYTQEQKAKGIVVKPLQKAPPAAPAPAQK
ncbi:hypothetical protein F9K50_05820 [bacterium]|nr:MAG: hypothetical protein F9K50_05820 [bacterium]